MVDFVFVDSQRNESMSNTFVIDSQGFIRTLVVLDRELQSNYTLPIVMFDPMLNSHSLPTYVIIQVLDENDNLPYEPFLSNPFDLLLEQVNSEETVIYEFKPIDLDDGPNGIVSTECLNCTSINYFHLIQSNLTNSSILMTKANVTVPDGIYTLAFLIRDHGLPLSRERFYVLKFNLTHRTAYEEENLEEFFPKTTSVPFLIRQKNLFTKFFLQKFQWRFLILLIVSWLLLVITAVWTCYRYDRLSGKKQKEKEQKQQFEIQVRQHEIINQSSTVLPLSLSIPINSKQKYEKETLTHDDDEIEDTSYDADHIITDANFVLTSGCATNESNVRYVSSFFFNLAQNSYK